jgi:hypothetical protein
MRGFYAIVLGKFGNFIPAKPNSYVAKNELFIDQTCFYVDIFTSASDLAVPNTFTYA